MNCKKLKANIEYTTPHGHVYRTDHKGRIKEEYVLKDVGYLIMRVFRCSRNIDDIV